MHDVCLAECGSATAGSKLLKRLCTAVGRGSGFDLGSNRERCVSTDRPLVLVLLNTERKHRTLRSGEQTHTIATIRSDLTGGPRLRTRGMLQ